MFKTLKKSFLIMAAMAAFMPSLATAQVVDAVNIALRGIGGLLSSGRAATPPKDVSVARADRDVIERQLDEALKDLPPEERAARREAALKQIAAAEAQATNLARVAAAGGEKSGSDTASEILRSVAESAPGGIMNKAKVLTSPAGRQAVRLIGSIATASKTPPDVIVHKLDAEPESTRDAPAAKESDPEKPASESSQ